MRMRLLLCLFLLSPLLWTPMASAQDTAATPTPYLIELPGLTDAVYRSFSSAQLVGLVFLGVEVAQFDTADHAGDAIAVIKGRAFANYALTADMSGIKRTSSRQLADRTVVYSGVGHRLDQTQPYVFSLAMVRDGSRLYVVTAFAVVGDPVSDSLDTVEKILARRPGDSAITVDSDGLERGGLWDLLPTLSDVPEGLSHLEDRRPMPFEPLPGQAP